MTDENEKTIKEIVGAIRRLVRAVYLDTSKMSRRYGLTGSQSGVLRNLAVHGPISSARLSRELYVSASNITGIIDRLERKRLVKRARPENDRRVALISLTETGEELTRSLPDPIEIKLISGLADLKSTKVKKLQEAMGEILNLIDAENVEDTPLR